LFDAVVIDEAAQVKHFRPIQLINDKNKTSKKMLESYFDLL